MPAAVEDQSITTFLDELAARAPTPGGGSVAALCGAQAAALLSMVARYTDEAHVPAGLLEETEELRARCFALMGDDAAAFRGVMAAYGLPRGTDTEVGARRAAIQHALAGAAEPPAAVAGAAQRLIELAAVLAPVANGNVITDVAVAADAARAAATMGRLNVEINLAGITDPEARRRLGRGLAGVAQAVAAADRLSEEIREGVLR